MVHRIPLRGTRQRRTIRQKELQYSWRWQLEHWVPIHHRKAWNGDINNRKGQIFKKLIGLDLMVGISISADLPFSGQVLQALHQVQHMLSLARPRFGPRESKKAMLYSDVGRLNCHVTYTTFSTPIRGQGFDNKEYSSMLHKALEGAIILETFPKTTVDIFALVLESGGGDLPVIISCASLAIADAGIMMYDLVSAVSLSCFGKNMVIDPTSEEEACQDGSLMITYMPSRNEVTQFTLTGEWSTAKINEAMELCLDACSKLADILRSCLKENASELTS
ncbi:hypothetical protein IEQ34_018764 [Dendrobium chrysotoxum]|uniref:Uncharacterized protein n=1 Tax=Dendrobium chrysotoxum TaxID=161865 RepID=A0AAV7G5N4_DENCH|nr:hypothetical protein IEQ34_018764 [Dendrobium chrysotoxum]